MATEFFTQGNSLQDLGKHQEAIECYNTAISMDPKYISAYYNKGLSLQNLKRRQEAIECYNKVISIDSKYIFAYYNKGLLLQVLGDPKEAIECYNKAISIDPKHVKSYGNKGNSYQDLGKHKKAIEYYNKAISLNPNYLFAYNNKGNSLQALKKHKEAVECYDKVISIDPNNARAYTNKGISLQDLKKPLEAIECFNNAISIDPKSAFAYVNKGKLLNDLGNCQEAVECFEKAISVDPSYADAYSNKGNALKNLGHSEEAIESYQQALGWRPKESTTHASLGQVWESMGKIDEAIESFRFALIYLEESKKSLSSEENELAEKMYKKIVALQSIWKEKKNNEQIENNNKRIEESKEPVNNVDPPKESNLNDAEQVMEEKKNIKNQDEEEQRRPLEAAKMDDFLKKIRFHLENQDLSEIKIQKVIRYSNAFVNTFKSCFTTAELIDNGNLKLDTPNKVTEFLSSVASFSPFLGKNLFSGIVKIGELTENIEIKRNARRMLRLAVDLTSMAQFAGEICFNILLDHNVQEFITESDEATETPLFNYRLRTFVEFCKRLGEEFDTRIHTSQFNSVQEKTANSNAATLIDIWLKSPDGEEKNAKKWFVGEIRALFAKREESQENEGKRGKIKKGKKEECNIF